MKTRTIQAAEFKQGCLAFLDEVSTHHSEIVITKRGRPVARLVPLETSQETEARILEGLRGRVRLLVSDEELMAPIEQAWEVMGDAAR